MNIFSLSPFLKDETFCLRHQENHYPERTNTCDEKKGNQIQIRKSMYSLIWEFYFGTLIWKRRKLSEWFLFGRFETPNVSSGYSVEVEAYEQMKVILHTDLIT